VEEIIFIGVAARGTRQIASYVGGLRQRDVAHGRRVVKAKRRDRLIINIVGGIAF